MSAPANGSPRGVHAVRNLAEGGVASVAILRPARRSAAVEERRIAVAAEQGAPDSTSSNAPAAAVAERGIEIESGAVGRNARVSASRTGS
jgi:hypothetical protein